MKTCKKCGTQNIDEAIYCSQCATKLEIEKALKKDEKALIIFSVVSVIILSISVLIYIIINNNTNYNYEDEQTTSSYNYTTESTTEETTTEQTTKEVPTLSYEYYNALSTALDYLTYSSFSRKGLIDQLKYEKFSDEACIYAVDNCGADWNEQAVKMAEDYLTYDNFSKQGLIDQLEYEGFTHEQAVYGVNQAYK